jgi:DNA-binding transcriptional LysR family regulator
MELRYLRYFVVGAEALSFTKAVQKLRLAQPSLIRQVRNPEDAIRVRSIAPTTGSNSRRKDAGSPREIRADVLLAVADTKMKLPFFAASETLRLFHLPEYARLRPALTAMPADRYRKAFD